MGIAADRFAADERAVIDALGDRPAAARNQGTARAARRDRWVLVLE
jgi:hypothetical protein